MRRRLLRQSPASSVRANPEGGADANARATSSPQSRPRAHDAAMTRTRHSRPPPISARAAKRRCSTLAVHERSQIATSDPPAETRAAARSRHDYGANISPISAQHPCSAVAGRHRAGKRNCFSALEMTPLPSRQPLSALRQHPSGTPSRHARPSPRTATAGYCRRARPRGVRTVPARPNTIKEVAMPTMTPISIAPRSRRSRMRCGSWRCTR